MADKIKVVENDQVREKLFNLMMRDPCPYPVVCSARCEYYKSQHCHAERYTDHLIANGVTVQEWISVKDRLPEEHDSIFAKLYGTEKWLPGMFRTISNDVNACVEYEDGTRKVKTLHTFDGKWNLRGMGGKRVTHWMPLPQPPKGE
jgi:hypothetical protein